jgi:hypothetical protein
VKERTSAPTESGPDTTTGDTSPDTTDAGPDTTLPVEVAAIEWGECDDEAVTDGELECATLDVPLDYEEPAGETIGIVMVRVPATDDREGAVLFNPGGPGGSGFDPIAYSGTLHPERARAGHFDLVGFDPRGVDRSGGIRASTTPSRTSTSTSTTRPTRPRKKPCWRPPTPASPRAARTNYGDTLKFYFSTVNTARDMDAHPRWDGRRADELPRHLLRHLPRWRLRHAVPRAGARDGARQRLRAQRRHGGAAVPHAAGRLRGAFNDWAKWCQEDATCPFTAADVGARWEALRCNSTRTR